MSEPLILADETERALWRAVAIAVATVNDSEIVGVAIQDADAVVLAYRARIPLGCIYGHHGCAEPHHQPGHPGLGAKP